MSKKTVDLLEICKRVADAQALVKEHRGILSVDIHSGEKGAQIHLARQDFLDFIEQHQFQTEVRLLGNDIYPADERVTFEGVAVFSLVPKENCEIKVVPTKNNKKGRLSNLFSLGGHKRRLKNYDAN